MMVADSTASTAKAKDALSRLEAMQMAMNTLLAEVKEMAKAESEL